MARFVRIMQARIKKAGTGEILVPQTTGTSNRSTAPETDVRGSVAGGTGKTFYNTERLLHCYHKLLV